MKPLTERCNCVDGKCWVRGEEFPCPEGCVDGVKLTERGREVVRAVRRFVKPPALTEPCDCWGDNGVRRTPCYRGCLDGVQLTEFGRGVLDLVQKFLPGREG